MSGGAEIFQELGVPCKIWNALVLEAADEYNNSRVNIYTTINCSTTLNKKQHNSKNKCW